MNALGSPAVAAIPGTRSLSRLEENAGAEDLEISEQERRAIRYLLGPSTAHGSAPGTSQRTPPTVPICT